MIQYSEKNIFVVYVIVSLCLIGLVCLMYFVNIGNYLHSYHPQNTIAAYYGTTPPKGWVLCDGTNGTPDLTGKFIYGGNIVSQNLYNNAYNNNSDKYFVNYTEQIEGGSNYQTLTNKVEILDKYVNTRPSNNTKDTDMENIINFNPNIETSHDTNDIPLTVFNPNTVEKSDLQKIKNVFVEINEVKPNIVSKENLNKIDPTSIYQTVKNIITPDELRQAEMRKLNKRIRGNDNGDDIELQTNNTIQRFDNDIIDDLKNVIKSENNQPLSDELSDSDFLTKFNAKDYNEKLQMIDEIEIDINVIVGPDFDGYKYPSHKNITADLNLPPFYVMIYIMKL